MGIPEPTTRRRPDRRLAVAICAIAFIATGIAVSTAPAARGSSFPGGNGKIAFESTRTGISQIYAVNPDGTGLTALTQSALGAGEPSWSADGTKIAFSQRFDGNAEIFSMNA